VVASRHGQGGAPARPRWRPSTPAAPARSTRAELAAYYRKHGFTPFQFDFGSGAQNPLAAYASLFGGSRPEPSVEEVDKAIFDLLDTGKTGKLTQKELTRR